MFLDTVDTNNHDTGILTAQEPLFARWENMPHSCISHHGAACCEGAREWFLAMDYSLLNGSSPLTGPRWIRSRYNWGPSKHPIYWCEAVGRKSLDCGVHAALANECFRERGVKSFPVQLVQQYTKSATDHWNNKWNDEETSTHWINGEVIYHEGAAVLQEDGTIKLWDASAGWWMNPEQVEGYGSLAALRIHAKDAEEGTTVSWGRHTLPLNTWTTLQRPRPMETYIDNKA